MEAPIRILPPKLRPPRLRENRIRRTRLLTRLDAIDTKVTLIVAPAGFGKSTLLSRWIHESEMPVAWLALGPEDDTLSNFLAYVTASLATATGEDEHGAVMLDYGFTGEGAAAAVLNRLMSSATPWTLAIDDYHVITRAEIHRFVTTLIDGMPDGCRLVIATRVDPPLPVARLAVNDDLTVLTSGDLRATPSECAEVLRQYDVTVSELQTLAIVERTAGWLAALHLVALASRSESIDRVIDSLRLVDGERDLLSDYLLQEVLGEQDQELRDFLLQISVLDRFSAETCYAITANANARQLLDQARRRGLFLIELDDVRTWFRFHSLFRDFLRRELALEVDPRAIPPLHAAASRWFRDHNLNAEALYHAVQGEDWAAAAAMITDTATQLFVRHRIDDLWSWLDPYPRDMLLANPDLSSIAAYALVRQGRGMESELFIEAAERNWQAAGNTIGLGVVELVRAARARFRLDADAVIEHGARCIALVTGEPMVGSDESFAEMHPRMLRFDGTWFERMPNLIPYTQIVYALIHQGRILEAEQLTVQVCEIFDASGDARTAAIGGVLTGLVHLARGRLVEAASITRPLAINISAHIPSERALSILTLAEVLYEWNQLEEAAQVLEVGIAALAQVHSSVIDAELQLQLAKTRWAMGDADATDAALTNSLTSAQALQHSILIRRIEATRATLAIATGELEFTRHWSIARGHSIGMTLENAGIEEVMTQARLLIAVGDAEQAIQLLERLRAAAAADARTHDLIHVLALESLAYLDQFELDQAVDVLGEALALSEPGGYVRVYLDEGNPMLRLLRIAHRRGTNVPYVEELLATAGETPGALTRVTHLELVEPITPREVDVLRLIALGLTNKEIGDELYVSVATVKRHITNLNGKLGVSSRTEAVQKARRLKLLPAGGVAARRLVSDDSLD